MNIKELVTRFDQYASHLTVHGHKITPGVAVLVLIGLALLLGLKHGDDD